MISDYDAINPALLGIHSLEIDILRAVRVSVFHTLFVTGCR
jgi:hypothetical protein